MHLLSNVTRINVGNASPVKQSVYANTFNSTADDIIFRSNFTSVQEAPNNMKRKIKT